jgi:hypothetical protein
MVFRQTAKRKHFSAVFRDLEVATGVLAQEGSEAGYPDPPRPVISFRNQRVPDD